MKDMQKFVSLKEVAHKFAEGYECPVDWYSMADDGSYVRICLAHCSWDDLTPDDVAKLFGFKYAALCEVKGEQGAMLFQCDYDLQSWKNLKTWERK
jgi:hypothetical protein